MCRGRLAGVDRWSRVCDRTLEWILAPRAGFEPATIRLTVECSTAELPRNKAKQSFASGQRITKPPGLAKDQITGFWAGSKSHRSQANPEPESPGGSAIRRTFPP